MSSLSKQQCEPYAEGSKPLKPDTARVLLQQLNTGWALSENKRSIVRDFLFENYYQTIAFVNAVAWVAHQQDHHPSALIKYKSCRIEYTTDSLSGLSINDFICAAKIDGIKQPETVDPELKSSDQPRQYATEAIKLSDLEQDIELNQLQNIEPSFDDSAPSEASGELDHHDEPIFNNDGEIIIEAIADEAPEPQIKNEPTKPSYLDTQTLIMSAEELKKLSEETSEREPPAIDEQSDDDIGDMTIPDSDKSSAVLPETTKPTPIINTEPKAAQTVIMSLSDLEQAQAKQEEKNNMPHAVEKTVIMSAPLLEETSFDNNEREDTQEVDPEIAEDDTLVMHANTYESVKK